jgi:catechol 2,3-dioxygenase-like lactoylglutathione lyase family enzyme
MHVNFMATKQQIMKKLILILIVVPMMTISCLAQNSSQHQKLKTMNFQDVYSVFITKDLKASTKFYADWFGFTPVFESTFFVLMSTPGERPVSVGFLSEVHPSSPPSAPALNAKAGVFLTLQTSNARSDYDKLKSAGLKISYELKDEPWGQRRFGVIDPNGMYIDIVEQIEPVPGFWDKYIEK